MQLLREMRHDHTWSAVTAGLIAVVVSLSGPAVLVFQAARLAHFPEPVVASWMWAIAFGSGITGLLLSVRFRAPVIIAWSTPGAALLVGVLPGYSPSQAIAAYLAAALVIAVVGMTGAFDTLMRKLPASIAAAMLAGILFHFGTEVFVSVQSAPLLVLSMILVYLLMRRGGSRFAVLWVLLAGLLVAAATGRITLPQQSFSLALPMLIRPVWSWHAVLNLGFPLALVALTGQYVPGIAVMRASGFDTPSRPIVLGNALASLLMAPSGAHGINPAAITAAICTGEEAHADPKRRYIAGVSCGIFYILAAFGAGALSMIFASLPKEWVVTLCGVALFGAIAAGLRTAFSDESQRDPALITFLVTASGMTLFGLGAAFWGIVAGVLAQGLSVNLNIWSRRLP